MKGVYLSLNQGVTNYKDKYGNKKAKDILVDRSNNFREKIDPEITFSSELQELISLGSGNYAPFYEAGNIYAKYYSANDLPNEDVFLSDLNKFLSIYKLISVKSSRDEDVSIKSSRDEDFHIFRKIARLLKKKELELNYQLFWDGIYSAHGFNPDNVDWDLIQYGLNNFALPPSIEYIADILQNAYYINKENVISMINEYFDDLDINEYDSNNIKIMNFLQRDDKSNHKQSIDLPIENSSLNSISLDNLLCGSENDFVEFKSTLRWSIKDQKVMKELGIAVAKNIAGFLNTKGGILLIGVQDDGSICGIEQDMVSLKKRNDIDGFQQELVQIIKNTIGIDKFRYINMKFEKKEKKTICIISIDPSKDPVFLNNRSTQKKEFYIRAGSTTQPLNH